LKEILTGIADLIFPPRCITCGEPLEQHAPLPFCPPCMAGIRFIDSPLCPRCGTPFPAAAGEDHFAGVSHHERPMRSHIGRTYEEVLITSSSTGKTGSAIGRMMADFAGRQWIWFSPDHTGSVAPEAPSGGVLTRP
jgi:predicted amidophosphoribosyltransferase